MKPKIWTLAGVAVLVVVGVVVGTSSGSDLGSSATGSTAANTATVERGKLSAMVTVNGALTYRARSDGSPYSAINRSRGTYTELPDVGERIDCGDVFYRVNDHPVLLLCGNTPAYRGLIEGDEGRDVRQLNRNLHRLGYDAAGGAHGQSGHSDFTWATGQALERLQADRGIAATGRLGLDDAVFLPGPARISEVSGVLGGSAKPGAQVARATSDTLGVRVDLDATQQGVVQEGDAARITLPGNRFVNGQVDRLASVAESPEGDDGVGAATVAAQIRLDLPGAANGLDRAPVRVDITTNGVENALSVPVVALVGMSGGGFAVEVVRGGEPGELVPVDLGLFDTAAGRVEVEGDLDDSDRVVVPSS